jgi:ABC-2 type transport system permease protein
VSEPQGAGVSAARGAAVPGLRSEATREGGASKRPARKRTVSMEWRKMRSVRSTWLIAAVFTAGMIGIAVLVGTHAPRHPDPGYDLTENAFAGLAVAQLLGGILGAMTLSTEFSSGLIATTFAAVPRRGKVLAAKAAVLAAFMLAAGEILAFAAFAAANAAVPHGAAHVSLSQPGVLRAVLMAGAYPCLVSLIGLGLAAIVRHTAGSIAAIVGLVFVLPLIMLPLGQHSPVMRFLPEMIAENSLTAVKPISHALSPGAGLGMLCLYAAMALAAGGLSLARRDA